SRFAAVAVASLMPFLLAAAPAEGTHYVALGDSFSSGQGTGRYYRDSGDCARGPLAYSALWAAANAVASYRSVACSGATTADVVREQVGALSARTTLVTISIGGNDIGAPAAMRECTIGSKVGCDRILAHARTMIATTLAGRLDATYAAIRRAAPAAKVVVVG